MFRFQITKKKGLQIACFTYRLHNLKTINISDYIILKLKIISRLHNSKVKNYFWIIQFESQITSN